VIGCGVRPRVAGLPHDRQLFPGRPRRRGRRTRSAGPTDLVVVTGGAGPALRSSGGQREW
jgi:hypothetical protein